MEVDPFDRGVIFEQRRTSLKPGTTNSCNGKKEDFKKSLHALINRDRSEFLYKSNSYIVLYHPPLFIKKVVYRYNL